MQRELRETREMQKRKRFLTWNVTEKALDASFTWKTETFLCSANSGDAKTAEWRFFLPSLFLKTQPSSLRSPANVTKTALRQETDDRGQKTETSTTNRNIQCQTKANYDVLQ